MSITKHIKFMNPALKEAKKAGQKDEVPVGALVVTEKGKILSSAHNQVIGQCDPTAHAEIIAIRKAASKVQNYRLVNTTMYVTVEPCIMCMGAIVHARISTLVFGTFDSKWGAAGSLYNFSYDSRLNHHLEIVSGICENECQALMQEFFRSKRI
jgi:tRNA(adenine34) deaminase